MQTLLTVCSLIGCLVSVVYAFAAARERVECEKYASRLKIKLASITGLEGAFDSLNAQLQKLRGQFHAFKHEFEVLPPPVGNPPTHASQVPPFCANYGQAQIEGPTSAAASCECDYCVEMRARRAELREKHVPKTAQGQAALAKLNAGKP